jgi:hypothetical protein
MNRGQMNAQEVIYALATFKVMAQRAVAALRDMEVALAEAEEHCKDMKALTEMRETYSHTRRVLGGPE